MTPVESPRRAPFALAGVALLLLACSVQKIWSADIWWQLATGRWIVENGRLPSTDVFSFTAAGHEWIELRWVYCVLAYLGWELGGPGLLITLQVLALAATFVLLAWPWRAVVGTTAGALALGMGVAGAMSRFSVRPELTTYLLIAVFLKVFGARSCRRDGSGAGNRALWLLPLLQIIWVSAHTMFIFGPLLAWLAFACDAMSRIADRVGSASGNPPRPNAPLINLSLLLTAAATTAACLLNPYGLRGALFPFLLLREMGKDHILGRTITEFLSPLQSGLRWSEDMYVAALLAGMCLATFMLNRRRFNLFRFAFWAACLYLAVMAVRNQALLAIASTWATLGNLRDLHAALARQPIERRGSPGASVAGRLAVTLGLLAAAWYVASDRFFVRQSAPRRFGVGVVEWFTPRQAVEFLRTARPKGNLLHSMDDGAYFSWALRDLYPVCVDGRLEVYGGQTLAEYLNNHADWRGYVEKHSINTLVLERRFFEPIIPQVAASRGWKLVHLDPRDLIFVRDIPEHAELIARNRIEPSAPWTPRTVEPDERPTGWRRWLGSVELPWHDLELAQNFIWLDSLRNAAVLLTRCVERFPENEQAEQLLRCIRLSEEGVSPQGPAGPAARASPATRVWAAGVVGESLIRSGRPREAVVVLRDGVAADPSNVAFHRAVASLSTSLGDFAAAREHLEAVLALRPGDAEARRGLELLRGRQP
ncbi:hypothetical protein RAS1_02040 [Phycisphaerae bacterium RAS1]|nr:hypothetical protein RAS1_02040 [Phycisphaerae bacterium RAS1]